MSAAPGRREQVLDHLRGSAGAASADDIAAALGVHANTVRYHLQSLIESGQVVRSPAPVTGAGRPALLYEAVRQMNPEGPRNWRVLAEIFATGLAATGKPAERARAAGRLWAEREAARRGDSTTEGQAAIAELVEVLEDLDFAPEVRPQAGDLPAIGLRHCPFLEMVDGRADVVCPAHLGLMQGWLDVRGADVTVTRLEALVEPDLCTAHLGTVGAK